MDGYHVLHKIQGEEISFKNALVNMLMQMARLHVINEGLLMLDPVSKGVNALLNLEKSTLGNSAKKAGLWQQPGAAPAPGGKALVVGRRNANTC